MRALPILNWWRETVTSPPWRVARSTLSGNRARSAGGHVTGGLHHQSGRNGPKTDGSMTEDLEIFRACADAIRLRLFVLLSERELCVCDLVVLEMPQGKISRHLAELRRAGLVSDRRVGTWIHYSLRRPDVPLANRLRMYLRGEARNSADAESDLTRLRNLADCGEICCQPESAPRRKQVVVE
ncbi:MAG TPA: metalloregulator ArsR/SmtB family transcription factor [Candidatus Handelsmanbacteria bacterium]|nr:metalloregulator ArsR/SmtB family transcription factor [Candidatus Handelsmanbacteria bacterium]